MGEQHLEAALPVGVDPRRHARALARVHEAAIAGETLPRAPRTVIGESWSRVQRLGIDPDRGPAVPILGAGELEQRRRESGLTPLLPLLRGGLLSLAEQAAHIMVVVDAAGHVLWRDGSNPVRHRADRLGFVEGVDWQEESVGTNAIGTALVARRPVQVYSAEHYVRAQHDWTCAAAPLHDPRDGRLLGVVDLSGPAATVHAATLALVAAVGRLAESQLRTSHLTDLEHLRGVAVPLLAKVSGRALVTDRHGWIAAATGFAPTGRLPLPGSVEPGPLWLPAHGQCLVEPLPGGWLVRLVAGECAGNAALPTRVALDLRVPGEPLLTVYGAAGEWTHRVSPRHAQLLTALAAHRTGCSASQLAAVLFGDATRTVTVRAEVSRLRRIVGGIVVGRPYRFADNLEVVVHGSAAAG
ncbi:helix-turn-helix domain-containing protein [Amycolatopsis sp. FDAARGOS 1241]|uniref:helix-turn-helix domain-containing protein n=1 Tax=Amycolatopsis sp. FDAARGOS 1241 TaxID=2778070 RepID=UPI001950177A|nr:helix-turn-helix domain-containing protein [Amycolatopsis sp. FDAARGOS 1241]QRP45624.1 GAF domain-containing protein [Amycolatopsis sp. FDAARGOS 1241]